MANPHHISRLVSAMEAIAPTRLAESWDNVGLLLGGSEEHFKGPILLCIDLTHEVLDEATLVGSSVVVCYHPPIFTPLKRLTGAEARQALLLRAARDGVCLYSPHTALDAAEGGMADWLADCCMEVDRVNHADRRALRPSTRAGNGSDDDGGEPMVKLVTFVPKADIDRVRQALATAGAGRIGGYEVCSFFSDGFGTFLGGPGTHPKVGTAGQLQMVAESRLEMVCPARALALAIETLKQFHPYETPALDVVPLLPRPARRVGVGRRLVLDRPATVSEVAQRLKRALGVGHVEVGAATDLPITTIGVCPGSGGELVDAAIAEGCELLVTGEMKHHDVLAATMRGLSVVLAGHTRTERPYLPLLAKRLGELLPDIPVTVSTADCDPLVTE